MNKLYYLVGKAVIETIIIDCACKCGKELVEYGKAVKQLRAEGKNVTTPLDKYYRAHTTVDPMYAVRG